MRLLALATLLVAVAAPVARAEGDELGGRGRLVSDMGDPRAEGPVSPMEKEVTVIEHLGETLPTALEFTDHTGKRVKLADYLQGRQRPVVITPMYFTCPTLCGVILAGVVASLKATNLKLGDDYDLITYSIDPKDTPALAAEKRMKLIHDLGYQESLPDWPFLVGDEAATRTLSEALGFRYKYDAEIKQFAHNAVFMILTPEGKISRYVYGVRFPPKDVRLALVEASEGKVGTAFDRFLLTCYRYDPAARRYEFFLKTYIRGGALLFFFALAGLLIVFWRRELRYGSGRKPPPTDPSPPTSSPQGART